MSAFLVISYSSKALKLLGAPHFSPAATTLISARCFYSLYGVASDGSLGGLRVAAHIWRRVFSSV